MNYYLAAFKNRSLNGRASRKEYWTFVLINVIIVFIVDRIDAWINGNGLISLVYALAVFIPAFALTVRRLHDTNRSGWWQLILLIPIIGWIAFIVFMVSDSESTENQHGQNPKGLIVI